MRPRGEGHEDKAEKPLRSFSAIGLAVKGRGSSLHSFNPQSDRRKETQGSGVFCRGLSCRRRIDRRPGW